MSRSNRVWSVVLVVITVAAFADVYLTQIVPAGHRSKQKRTMADMRTIATGLEAWADEHHQYPVVANVDALVPLLEPAYVKRLARVDGWGRPFRYEISKETYTITSAARDG